MSLRSALVLQQDPPSTFDALPEIDTKSTPTTIHSRQGTVMQKRSPTHSVLLLLLLGKPHPPDRAVYQLAGLPALVPARRDLPLPGNLGMQDGYQFNKLDIGIWTGPKSLSFPLLITYMCRITVYRRSLASTRLSTVSVDC